MTPCQQLRDASRIILPEDELQGNSRVRAQTYASLIPKSCNFLKQFSNKKSPPCSTLLINPGNSKRASKRTISSCVCTGQQGRYCSCALPEAEAPAPHAPGGQHVCRVTVPAGGQRQSNASSVAAPTGARSRPRAAQLRELQLLPLLSSLPLG